VRFTPGRGAVDHSSWRLHKIASAINPYDVRCLVGSGWGWGRRLRCLGWGMALY